MPIHYPFISNEFLFKPHSTCEVGLSKLLQSSGSFFFYISRMIASNRPENRFLAVTPYVNCLNVCFFRVKFCCVSLLLSMLIFFSKLTALQRRISVGILAYDLYRSRRSCCKVRGVFLLQQLRKQ